MASLETNDLLNRILVLQHRSAIMYLSYAKPWNAFNKRESAPVLERIAENQRELVDRLGRYILDNGGTVSYGEFPMLFTGWHDVSSDYLLKTLEERQKKEVEVVEKLADGLRLNPTANALALEALGASKAHLDMIAELRRPVAASHS